MDVLPPESCNIDTFSKNCFQSVVFSIGKPCKILISVNMPEFRNALFLCVIVVCFEGYSQRSYLPSSVLASGNWYKVAVTKSGIYKIDIPFLNNLGINTSNLASSSIRLYGNGGQMLAEANAAEWMDDLAENSIMIVDGGDGLLNGADHILFFANGPDHWMKDSINLRFSHTKNLYSDKAFYFLNIGGNGKRITTVTNTFSPNITITGFTERYFHELDTINFLNSGKEWYGEEFANAPGKTLSRNFIVNIPNLQNGTQGTLITNCVSRSVGSAGRFDISLNNSGLGQMIIPAISGGVYDLFAQQSTSVFSTTINQSNLNLNYSYIPGSFNAQGWLNWFEFFWRRNLSMNGVDQLLFRDWNSVNPGHAGEFIFTNANAGTQVWEITDPLNPVRMQTSFTNNEIRFVNDCSRLREYIAFHPNNFLLPEAVGRISNQDLHNTSPADYMIITHTSLLSQAQRLAQFHQQQNNLRTVIVTTDQVFNEFASGSPDATSLRDFIKMYFDKYGNNAADKPKYVLLFGDASFDYKNRLTNNTNLVPAFQSSSSLDPLASYTSDDFFGFLDDNEDINSTGINNFLDVGIGRVPAKNIDEAKNFVDKVEAYHHAQSFGSWRNDITFITDDEDLNLHLQDAEIFAGTTNSVNPLFNIKKIYLDAYQQVTGPGGSHYPQANIAINNQVYNGTLIWNYTGHGGPGRLAEETVLDLAIVNSWDNASKLPLFITATCDFAPYDNPSLNSLGENILLRPKTGGIALMTTTRAVFAFSNRIMNNNYILYALQPDASGKYRTLGEAVKEAKNYTYQTSGDIINNRKFTLLGDPALTLGFPTMKIRTTRVNNVPVGIPDTLRATEKVEIEGEITDVQGNLLVDFNGSVYPSIYDKPRMVNTLANDPASQPVAFLTQTNLLFKGKATVSNGRFSFSFKVPKDINYNYGNGRLSLYAEDGLRDAAGIFSDFIIGGTADFSGNDNEGPVIKAYLNDEKFINGGTTNQTPLLIIKLYDSSGINTVGTAIGHDLVATLDENHKYFILNDFFRGDIDSYQQGEVRFQLPSLEAGHHTLKIKAWDIMNNSSELVLDFVVASDEELMISHVLNYPNPFTTKTQFWFEHNKPLQDLQVKIQIFTLSGKLIKQIIKTINTPGNRSSDIDWDGKDDYGSKVGRGVYLYKLTVSIPGFGKKEKIEKIVIF